VNDKIEQRIRSIFAEIPKRLDVGTSDRAWTKAIFKSLSELGEELGFTICSCCQDGEYECGWLYDLIWYKENANKELQTVPLILECEWRKKYESIKYDFEKLLISKCRYKIMIFQAKQNQITDYFHKLKSAIRAFDGSCKNETYFLACFVEEKWRFEIEMVSE
jgi:hypothetical protein